MFSDRFSASWAAPSTVLTHSREGGFCSVDCPQSSLLRWRIFGTRDHNPSATAAVKSSDRTGLPGVLSSKTPPSLTRRFSSLRLPMAAAFNQCLYSMLALIPSLSFLVSATPECLVPAPMRNRSRFGSFLEKLGMRRSTRET